MEFLWSPHAVADAKTVSSLIAGDRLFIEELFVSESLRVRHAYNALGDPRVAYAYGKGISDLTELVSGFHMAIAVFEAQLAELILASGGIPANLGDHIDRASTHGSRAPASSELRGRVLSKVLLLRVVSEKASGRLDQAFEIFEELNESSWWVDDVNPSDKISLDRQLAMMRGTLVDHLRLLDQARQYEASRPLEYFRTLKRVFEFVTNNGLTASVQFLQPRVLNAYAVARSGLNPLSRVSLLKNLAQSNGLLGHMSEAKRYVESASDAASALGLLGQQRQISKIARGLEAGTVVGTLTTFRVPS